MRSKSVRWTGAMLTAAALLVLPACDRDSTTENGHEDLASLQVIDRGDAEQPTVATWTLAGGWEGELPAISLASANQRVVLGLRGFTSDGDELQLEEDGEFFMQYRVTDQAQEVLDMDHANDVLFHGDHVYVHGQTPGSTEIRFQLYHVDHVERETGDISISVVD